MQEALRTRKAALQGQDGECEGDEGRGGEEMSVEGWGGKEVCGKKGDEEGK